MKDLTTAEAARRLGVARQTVVNHCLAGTFPGAHKHGRDWVIPERDLAKFTRDPRGRPRKEQ